MANDITLIKKNNVTNIINLNPKRIENLFDREHFTQAISQYDKEEREEINSANLLGKIRYFNVPNWSEHTIDLNITLCDNLFRFIEEAV